MLQLVCSLSATLFEQVRTELLADNVTANPYVDVANAFNTSFSAFPKTLEAIPGSPSRDVVSDFSAAVWPACRNTPQDKLINQMPLKTSQRKSQSLDIRMTNLVPYKCTKTSLQQRLAPLDIPQTSMSTSRVSRPPQRRLSLSNEQQRRHAFFNDPWIDRASLDAESVVCNACNRQITLEKGRKYYPLNWRRHRLLCLCIRNEREKEGLPPDDGYWLDYDATILHAGKRKRQKNNYA
ncbi:hypothetical protein VNI00_006159 [Paramarasmius palmivorus]|uniref:Uncharacterized protein n=1 Tax=Paramarasmius palmivorus TaxID=297713 RepID=A0AAW0D510_9AGAR